MSPLQSQCELQVLAVAGDITKRGHAEKALCDREERVRSVFEVSPLGLGLTQRCYRLAKANASLCRMLAYSEAELTRKTPSDLTHPEDLEKGMALNQRLLNGEIPSYQIEERDLKTSGEIMWATLTRGPDSLTGRAGHCSV